MKKIVFIDVDGTLARDDQTISDKTIEASKKARANGHRLFLCTGRSKAELFPSILEIGFDGLICAGGGYAELQGVPLFHKCVSIEEVKHVVQYFDTHHIDYYLESNGGLFGSKHCLSHIMKLTNVQSKEDHPFTNALISDADVHREDINKVCFLQPTVPFQELVNEFDQAFEVIHCTIPMFGDDSGELAVKGVSKSNAIQEVLRACHMKKEDSIAIGDGMNDADMLSFCEVGIAMGNAKDGLKAIADMITDTIDEVGFYKAFVTYHLI